MDENNLDSLLDELSSMDGELNENIDIDSGVDVDADDMDDISLDELDHLDGMDLGDLDFDDIDFDDVDITKLDAGANPVVKKKPQEQETDDMARNKGGSGLGLSIVKQIFILHGFQFGVKSEEGIGSTFWFEMDRVQPPKDEEIEEKAE